MGKNFFASLIGRVFPVAQYARKPSVWWHGKEYPWDGKRRKYMRWSMGPNGPFAEEPDFNNGPPGSSSGGGQKDEEKPVPPMVANHPTSRNEPEQIDVQTSEDFLKAVAIERSKTMPPEIAEWERAKTRTFVAGLREYIKQDIELRRLREQYRQLTNLCDQSKGTDRYPTYVREIEEVTARGLSLRAQTDKFAEQIDSRKKKLSDKDREQNLAFLKAAFPDRDGSSFVTSDFKKEALAGFKKLGIEKDAQYILDVVDIIGKSFNISNKQVKPPKLFFGTVVSPARKPTDKSKGTLESRYDRTKEYNRYKGTWDSPTIMLSDKEEHRDCLMNRFALHLGEWINEEVLSLDQMEDNQDWLQRETGDYYVPGFGESYTIPQEKAPFLCVEPDGSSMNVSQPHFHHGSQKKNRLVFCTDVFPTGIQWLAVYPEMFAIQSPKHFDQMLRNFRALGIRNKRT